MKIIKDDPNPRHGNPDNEDMRTTVLINEDTKTWQEQGVDTKTLTSPEPVIHVNHEPMTQVRGTEYPKIG